MEQAPSDRYEDSLIVKEALQVYFSKYHFENGGYDLKWFRIKVGRLFIPLPNTKARVAAVKIHDIHHLITNYPATLKGEAQIAGWELAGGCGKHYAAWLLNDGSFFYGMFFFPRSMFRAFARGRACRTNLYYDTEYNETLLHTTLGELRNYVGLGKEKRISWKQVLLFFGYCIVSLITSLVFWATVLFPVVLLQEYLKTG